MDVCPKCQAGTTFLDSPVASMLSAEALREYAAQELERYPELEEWCFDCIIEHIGRELPKQKKYLDLRNRAIAQLGMACACCGEATPEFLVIDHAHGGGNDERRRIGQNAIMKKIVNGTAQPGEYRLLCANCNHVTSMHNGWCLHAVVRALLASAEDSKP